MSRPALAPVSVAYKCHVTFPGGETIVDLAYTFLAGATPSVRSSSPYRATIEHPVITPDTRFQTQVQNVAVRYRLPANTPIALIVASGGSGLGPAGATLAIEGNELVVRAAGPFIAGTPFQLPTLDLFLVTSRAGTAQVTTGGVDFTKPAFSWTRSSTSPGDPPGTLRPLECQPPAPVAFTSTRIT